MRKTIATAQGSLEKVRYFSERLWGALGSLVERPLTVVEAPMVYGKTEAVKAYLAQAPVRSFWTTARAGSPE